MSSTSATVRAVVSVSADLVVQLSEWSEPVQFKLERDPTERTGWSLTFRQLDAEHWALYHAGEAAVEMQAWVDKIVGDASAAGWLDNRDGVD